MVAGRIRELRELQNLSQTELGKRLGITRSSVNAWEVGINLPSTHYLIELSKIFRVSTDYILGLTSQEVLILDGLSSEEKSLIQGLVRYFRVGDHSCVDHLQYTSEESVAPNLDRTPV